MPKGPIKLMHRVYKYVLPEVELELNKLRTIAAGIPDPELRTQALNSMNDKKFHCQGGGVYAAANLEYRHVLIPLIVALQTISDYLDNLCDRSTSLDPEDFRLLHQSMLDAVNPKAEIKDYYAYREEKNDGGYLHHLVKTCQINVAKLPSYQNVQKHVSELVGLYGDLQVYKHIHQDLRETQLLAWWECHESKYPELQWNEFAAATGSTLGMFMLFLAASEEHLSPQDAESIRHIYFPHVCGLHILLDYLIDQEEDQVGGDLNFCNYYENQSLLVERIGTIVIRAREDVTNLPGSKFHRLIIEGLLALYLSDPKVRHQSDVRKVSKQLMKNSPLTRLFFLINSMWIRKQQA
ncbi:tetraprenyl-beta-curcumene synthase family protein [Paenibacillus sp. GSMTC-2017]|uniref:tetraprenyl-beta-curcumene synthase family protein n=1 Tax=Paenibacillus sp. GSMTC-2017 TaxID=2794350 RepID=UPI0018D9081B|nr:tetraprenyl-beta-curcumene synthase family protein [Paenibacillus sp. GSMTC-2017]MBH5318210.1 tetraprenyl-beta-curcumene synthase family protein [Paenibacillus sp. GSMTC-2017]